MPGTFHVGLLAPLEVRVQTLMQRENYTREEAENYGAELEQAHENFFRRFFNYNFYDPTHYHMMLNMGLMSPETAAGIIVHANSDIFAAPAAATGTPLTLTPPKGRGNFGNTLSDELNGGDAQPFIPTLTLPLKGEGIFEIVST